MDEIGGHVLSEISQTEKYKYWIYHLNVESKKKCNTLVIITKKKQTYRYGEWTSGYQWGEGEGLIGLGKWEVQTSGCKISNKDVCIT